MSLLAGLKQYDEDLASLVRKTVDMQINYMLLQHAACLKIKQDEIENGMIMFDIIQAMIDAFEVQRQEMTKNFGENELKEVYQKKEYDKLFYSSVTDAVLRSNTFYFELAPRPQGAEYICDEAECDRRMQEIVSKYFPNISKAA